MRGLSVHLFFSGDHTIHLFSFSCPEFLLLQNVFSFSKFENSFVMLSIIIAYLRHSGDSSEEQCWISGFLAELVFPLGITPRLDLTSFDIALVTCITVKAF